MVKGERQMKNGKTNKPSNMKCLIDTRKTETFGHYVVCHAKICDNIVTDISFKVYEPEVYREYKFLCDM